ncbi:hypothetical protein EC968_006993 [Mortierella alpina]|nr:hypothetical protein EC968_006993 [Mortierella alpina]
MRSMWTSTSRQTPSGESKNKVVRRIAHVSPGIFPSDRSMPQSKPQLPAFDARFSSTHQLVYCLSLLSKIPLSPPNVTVVDETLDEAERSWVQAVAEDADEQDRLRSLPGKLIAVFIDDGMKEPAAVVEIVSLAPVLTQTNYRKLLNNFIVSFEKGKLLEFELLDGLAQLVQSAQGGHLLPSDLVSILDILSTRLQDTHQQSSTDLYALVRAVSNVLDAMADCDVKGLNREELHEPLSRYLDGLKDNSDLYLVYHAAYAYQALQYIPDDESPLQSVLRRARVVVSGISGMVSAVKGLDLNKFLDGLEDIQEGLAGAYQTVKAGFKGVASAVEMIDSGSGLLDSLKEELSFSHKCAWYPALRGSDAFVRNGQLSKFKRLVCKAPCRRDAAFQLGICQRLGEIAANPLWENNTRQQAVDFLCELYKNDTEWGKQASSKKWILTVLVRLTMVPSREIKEYALVVHKDLEKSGDGERQELYRAHMKEASSFFPLETAPPVPLTSSLLTRLKDRNIAVYIPPLAKASQQASDSASFDLMENVEAFFRSDSKVFLLLGVSGAGKTTFTRELECVLWTRYSSNENAIPLFIHLPSIHNPEKDLIAKHLHRCNFQKSQIQELKNIYHFILILDGYDECQEVYNLHTSNNFNGDGLWQVKMIISCRSGHLGQDYKDRFQPATDAPASISNTVNRLQEAVIVPFSTDQIHDYIHRYVAAVKPPWRAKSYLAVLARVPNLMDLIRNPFLLTLALDVLPGFVDTDNIQELSDVTITRVGLYDRFVEHWLERSKKRAERQKLSQQSRAAFNEIVAEGFTANGTRFVKQLAAAIYKEQNGLPTVEYSCFEDRNTWKAEFFSHKVKCRLLREACPLVCNGNQHRFVHKSLLEYCFTLVVFDPQERSLTPPRPSVTRRGSVSSMFSFEGETTTEECGLIKPQEEFNSPLGWRSFLDEHSILQFLAERAQQEPHFKEQLLLMIERSKTDKGGRIAAANAITILVRAGMHFIGADLRGIRILDADLSFGMFEGAQLQGADLRKVNFSNTWLRQADLSDSQMVGVRFGEWPYLQEDVTLRSFAYSQDGKSLAAGLITGKIVIYDTVTWTSTRTLLGHTSAVYTIAYSKEGHRIASGGLDKIICLWDSKSGPTVLFIDVSYVVETVLFSPNGLQIASYSWDRVVRLWDAQTGALDFGSTEPASIHCLAYSPNGNQIALGCSDGMIRFRDTQSGAPGPISIGPGTASVRSIAYSPDGRHIATGSTDKTVRLWDTQTGSLGLTLIGHSDTVSNLAYSPSGHQIASGSEDKTVRLWDAQTGMPGAILSGHLQSVKQVSYSPSGD